MTQVRITSAVELSSTQLEKVAASLKKKYGTTPKIEQVINPELIGGVQVAVNSEQIDRSLKAKLDQVKTVLITQL